MNRPLRVVTTKGTIPKGIICLFKDLLVPPYQKNDHKKKIKNEIYFIAPQYEKKFASKL